MDGAIFLVEGETDAMRLWQELGGNLPVVGIGGINTWRSSLSTNLTSFKRVYVILDNDQDYMVKAQVDSVWREIRHDVPRAKRVNLPGDVKDLCEFFSRYDVETLDLYCKKASVSRFKPIDFSLPPPPVRWLLKDWIAMGDVTVLAGKGGTGKSWLTMALAMAVLNGSSECVGEKVYEHGRVFYTDEENPVDVVYKRMLQLGLDPMKTGTDLRFLWNNGVRLDRDADALLDEMLDFKPVFGVFDSLSRLHSGAENEQGEMGKLLNDCLKPLARETGAGVILIHHHDKGANAPRGSTDIVNAADAVIEVYDYGLNKFRMVLTKSRRRSRGPEIIIGITDQPDGSIKLVVDPPMDLSF